MSKLLLIPAMSAACILLFGAEAWAGESSQLQYGAYLDLGYLNSSTQPANHTWRSKGTSHVLDRVKFNNATAWLAKDATAEARWGYELGLQAGVDVDDDIPDESFAIDGAVTLSHLYYTSLSYLFPVGSGLELRGGLLPGFPGYPSFHAIDNPSYTRTYGVDYVPYFLWGLRASYPMGADLSGSLFLVTGWDYLDDTNDVPGYGLQVNWQLAEDWSLTQNLYYGSEQKTTAMEYWRFVSDTNLEWQNDHFLAAASLTYGTEKRGDVVGEPRQDWTAASLWIQWRATAHWHFALQPELFDDPQGLQTGARQTLTALALTAEYRFLWREKHDLSARAELRFDRSTGEGGGFYEGSENRLVEDQRLFILALMWAFDSGVGTEESRTSPGSDVSHPFRDY